MTSAEELQHLAAQTVGAHRADILCRSRHRSISRARQVAMLLCRDVLGMSYPELGRAFRRDHTTVVHGVRRARRDLATDQELWRSTVRQVHRLIVAKHPSAESPPRFRIAV